MPDHSPSTDERASLAQPSQSSSPLECTSHLGFSLVGQHPCYDGWNAGLRGNCLHRPNMSWQWSCTKRLIITTISGY